MLTCYRAIVNFRRGTTFAGMMCRQRTSHSTVAPSWKSIFPAAASSLVTKLSAGLSGTEALIRSDTKRSKCGELAATRTGHGRQRLGQRAPGLIYV